MFAIYADDNLEQDSKSKKPENYRAEALAKMLFQAGCEVVGEESEKRRMVLQKTTKLPVKLRKVCIGRQRAE